MQPPPPLFSRPVGAYRRLDSFTLATVIQTETWTFCHEFLDTHNDPKGRWFDQMTQAARSGRANIAEGAENSLTSKETELKLLGIARGSLAELLADYEMWLAYSGALPWSREEAAEVHRLPLDPFPETSGEGLLRASVLHARAQRAKFARWLNSSDPCIRANCLMVLILRAMELLRRQMEHLGGEFARTGGLREQMSATRRAVRDGSPTRRTLPPAPMRTSHAPPPETLHRRTLLGLHRLRPRLPRHPPDCPARGAGVKMPTKRRNDETRFHLRRFVGLSICLVRGENKET